MNQKQIIYNKETHNTGFETSPALTANTRHTPDYSLRTKGTKPTSADVPPKPDRLKDNNQSERLLPHPQPNNDPSRTVPPPPYSFAD